MLWITQFWTGRCMIHKRHAHSGLANECAGSRAGAALLLQARQQHHVAAENQERLPRLPYIPLHSGAVAVTVLKGVCYKIFHSNSFRPLINSLKYFQFRRFRRDIWSWSSKILTLRCDAHHGVWFRVKMQISRRNLNWIRKYFSPLIRGPVGFDHEKKL